MKTYFSTENTGNAGSDPVWHAKRFRGLLLPGGDRLRPVELVIMAVLGLFSGLMFWVSVWALAFSVEHESGSLEQGADEVFTVDE